MSALVDGRLPDAEAQRCWEHVQTCPGCRDLVEREGWLKRQLAGLSSTEADVSDRLKDQLRATASLPPVTCTHKPWSRGMVAVGGSALGVAVLGALALGSGAPVTRGPTASLGGATPTHTAPQPPATAPVRTGPLGTATPAPRRRPGAGPAAATTPVSVLSSLTSAEVVELVVTMSLSSRAFSSASAPASEPVRGTMAP